MTYTLLFKIKPHDVNFHNICTWKGLESPIYLYFVDKFGKKDVEDTSRASHSSTYPSILRITDKEFEDMVLYLFVNGCIIFLSSLKMNKLD